jgi:hypothetical protein
MSNAFDSYREALVIEHSTIWPAEIPGVPENSEERERIAAQLHADPAHAAELEYIRLHAGFHRKITVTAEDLKRLR